MKKCFVVIASLMSLVCHAQEVKPSALFVFAAVRDDYDPGAGFGLRQNLTESISVFISVESVRFDETTSYNDSYYSSRTKTETDGFEVQIGYLHHVWKQDNGLSLEVGPVIGFEELDGKITSSYGGEYGSGSDRTDIDYDLGINVYLQALLRYQGFKSMEVVGSVAYGYRSSREIRYSGGGPIPLAAEGASDIAMSSYPYSFSEGSESFLRATLGVAIPF